MSGYGCCGRDSIRRRGGRLEEEEKDIMAMMGMKELGRSKK
jgi:hypothetical protein